MRPGGGADGRAMLEEPDGAALDGARVTVAEANADPMA